VTYTRLERCGASSPSSGRLRKVPTRPSISLHSRDTWLFDMPVTATSAFSVVRRGSKNPENTSFPELRNANVDRSGTRLPLAIAIAIATVATVDATLTIFGAATLINLELHEPLDDVPEEVSDDIILRPLFDKLGKCDTGLGHRGGTSCGSCYAKRPSPGATMAAPFATRATPAYTTRGDTIFVKCQTLS